MKLVLISLGSWLVGLVLLVSGLNLIPTSGASQVSGPNLASLIVTALVFSLAYGPWLKWLKTRLGEVSRSSIFPFTSSIILNLPVFLIAMLANGRTLLSAEAYAVMVSFAVMGATFGVGFVWSSARPKRINEASIPQRIITSKQALVSRAS